MKFCTKCKRWLPYSKFKSNQGWMHPFCRDCNKKEVHAHLKAKRAEKRPKVNKYGLEVE